MSQHDLAALAGAGTVIAVALTAAARTVRPGGRHRAPQPNHLTTRPKGD